MPVTIKSIALALGVASCALASSANAALVTKDIHFEVSGASGGLPAQSGNFSFTYDDAVLGSAVLNSVDFAFPGYTFDTSTVGIADLNDRWAIGGTANGILLVQSPGPADFQLLFDKALLTPLVYVYHLPDTDGNGIAAPGMPGVTLTVSEVAPVPEPATWLLLLGGFGLAGATLRHRRAQARVAFAH